MNIPRTRNDLCLLCKKSKASATGSHIYTKFITASMFGDKHNKQGGAINTAKFDYGNKANDTPKQDFLLCPNCENIRLGTLETYISTFFYSRYKNEKFAGNFPIDKRFNIITGEVDCMILNGVHTGMFKLYMYSLVWRASICTLSSFQNFKLNSYQEEILRGTLDNFLRIDAKSTIDFYNANFSTFPQFPFVVQTHLEQVDAGSNFVLEPWKIDASKFIIYLNEFIILFYMKWDSTRMFSPSYNPGNFPINIALLNYQQWRGLIKSVIRKTVDAWLSNHKQTLSIRKPNDWKQHTKLRLQVESTNSIYFAMGVFLLFQ